MTSLYEKRFISMLRENKSEFYRLAYSYVKNEQDALDVVGEATYKALSSLDKLKNIDHMKTWFYRILINESITLLRKNKRIVYDSNFIENLTYEGACKDDLIDLYKAIDQLNEEQRNVIILKYIKGLRIREISDILSININTVKSRLKRGVDKLRTMTGR